MKLAALGRLTANIAHEIRNPLSAISHAGELLAEERREETQDRLLRIVNDNTQRLESASCETYSNSGDAISVHREAIEPKAFLSSFLEEFCSKEREPMVVHCACSNCPSLCFDRSHLHQVLWNVIGNALRHSHRGRGSVVVELVSADAAHFELHIRDDGEGVPAALREQVFEPFLRPTRAGPGLACILHESCAKPTARGWNWSTIRRGSLQDQGICQVMESRADGRTDRRARGELRRVLVVDDEADIRELLDLTLSRMGLAADCAASVGEARSLLASCRYHLCLTDMRLPDGEGLDVVRAVGELCPQTPVAVITAFGSTENAVAALKAGAFDYLAKPVALDQLRTLIKSALELPNSDEQVAARIA